IPGNNQALYEKCTQEEHDAQYRRDHNRGENQIGAVLILLYLHIDTESRNRPDVFREHCGGDRKGDGDSEPGEEEWKGGRYAEEPEELNMVRPHRSKQRSGVALGRGKAFE